MDNSATEQTNIVQNENKKVYAAIASTYDKAHPEIWNNLEQRRARRLVAKALYKKNPELAKVFDFGAGTGNLAIKLLDQGCHVTCIDISPAMLNILAEKIKKENFTQYSLKNIPAEEMQIDANTLDGVCFSSVLHHIYDFKLVLRNAIDALKKEGFLLIMHEPIVQQPKSKFRFKVHRIIGAVDEFIYRQAITIKKIPLNSFPSDEIAEFHQSSGMFKQDEILRTIQESMQVVLIEQYVSRRYSFFAWLSTKVVRSENSFAVIAIKK